MPRGIDNLRFPDHTKKGRNPNHTTTGEAPLSEKGGGKKNLHAEVRPLRKKKKIAVLHDACIGEKGCTRALNDYFRARRGEAQGVPDHIAQKHKTAYY